MMNSEVSPSRESEIGCQIRDLGTCLDELQAHIEQLESNMGPSLRPAEPPLQQVPCSDKPDISCHSEVWKILHVFTDRVADMRGQIISINNRLEI